MGNNKKHIVFPVVTRMIFFVHSRNSTLANNSIDFACDEKTIFSLQFYLLALPLFDLDS